MNLLSVQNNSFVCREDIIEKDLLSKNAIEFLKKEKYDIKNDPYKLLLISNSELDSKLKVLRIDELKNKIKDKFL